MIKPWKTLSSETIFDTNILTLKKVKRQSAITGNKGEFYTMDTPDWVNVIAVTPDDEVVLIRQYRHGIDDITLEIPGGLVDEGELPGKAAARELQEETGFTGDDPISLGYVDANPAIQTNRCYTFLIQNARLTDAKDLQEHEEIEMETRPLSGIPEIIRNQVITHSLVVAGLYRYFLWKND
ncbi:MAG: NUDIX hydrolase [Candidatus Marinimicrobia bacterium]|nr:NUDIX hydrolase [Candidatus Neomarinimicrobiota bacterium]MCF7827530.1 NUDIX hydrolase [Candidatus Neomarinimicrobiota bacterium]MCF7881608.1 NUDIX hydrolase [Candidatus Neomarinimicrobiota bacterium]